MLTLCPHRADDFGQGVRHFYGGIIDTNALDCEASPLHLSAHEPGNLQAETQLQKDSRAIGKGAEE